MTGYERTIYTFTKQPKAQPGRVAITVLCKRIEGVTLYQWFTTENEAADHIDAEVNTKLAMHGAWINPHAMPKTPTA